MNSLSRTRPSLAALALVVGGSVGLACSDDAVAEPETYRACGRAITWGGWDDGTMHTLGTRRHVCLCMSEDEFESQSRLEELHEFMLEDCLQEAASFEMDWNDCQQEFDSQIWITISKEGDNVFWPATVGVINPPGVDLVCP